MAPIHDNNWWATTVHLLENGAVNLGHRNRWELLRRLWADGLSPESVDYFFDAIITDEVSQLFDSRRETRRTYLYGQIFDLERAHPSLIGERNCCAPQKVLKAWQPAHEQLCDCPPIPTDRFWVWYSMLILADSNLEVLRPANQIQTSQGVNPNQISRAMSAIKTIGLIKSLGKDKDGFQDWVLTLPVGEEPCV